MARPLASPLSRSVSNDRAAVATPVAVLATLAVFIGWPVAAVIGSGPGPLASAGPLAVVIRTLGVGVASAAAALAVSLVLAHALTRVDLPGRGLAWRVLRLGVVVPPFVAPLALLTLAGSSLSGSAAIVLGQALAFLPHATILLVRALADVPAELERAAEVLGASRLTVWRRVTLRLAGARLRMAALAVLGLCLADVAAPLLLGGDAVVLATAIVVAAAGDVGSAAGPALALTALGTSITLAGATWRHAQPASESRARLPRLDRPVPAVARWSLGSVVWVVATMLATLWAIVPLGSFLGAETGLPSLEHWAVLASPAGARPLANSLALGLGAALAGTALALATAWSLDRGRTPLPRGIDGLVRVPLAVPGVAAGVGYVLGFGAPALPGAGTLLLLVAVVACWELPVTVGLARVGLASVGPGAEQAALSLGARRATTLWRIVLPALRPTAGWILGYSFAAGALAIATVIVLAGPGPGLGSTAMLALAASGTPGAACAVATALLVLAGGAGLLGRALAGREHAATLLA